MNEHDNKDELIQLIEDSDLDSTSEAYLKHKLDLNRITEKEKLEKEISIEKRKTELRKIVEKEDLDYTPKSIISYKIQQNFILSEYELKKELAVEKRKNEPVNEIEQKRKIELLRKAERRHNVAVEDEYYDDEREDEDMETWQKTKEFDNYILDSRFNSKDDYSYGDVDYENDSD